MKRWLSLALMLVLVVWGSTAWAASATGYSAEAIIYEGYPGYGYDQQSTPDYESPHAYGSVGRGDYVEALASGWTLGGRLHDVWDHTYQNGYFHYAYASFDQDFKVSKAGQATINFSWDGSLQVVGDTTYNDAGWYLYGDADILDSRGTNAEVYWYEELESIGSLNPSASAAFNYNFTDDDIGEIFTISLTLQTEVGGGTLSAIDDGKTLVFDSDFYNTLKIDSFNGGIKPVGGSPIPIPAAIWLLGSGLLGLVAVRRRKKG